MNRRIIPGLIAALAALALPVQAADVKPLEAQIARVAALVARHYGGELATEFEPR